MSQTGNTGDKKCKECGKAFPDFDIYNSDSKYGGYCYECWIQKLTDTRIEYGAYNMWFYSVLRKHGIEMKPTHTRGLEEDGTPINPVIKNAESKIIPLREKEYAVYLFDFKGGIFAYGWARTGLGYIKYVPEMESVCKINDYLLAAGTDGEYLYTLTVKGQFLTTNPNINPAEINMDLWGEPSFDPIDFCIKVREKFFTEEEFKKESEKYKKYEGTGNMYEGTDYTYENGKFYLSGYYGNPYWHDGGEYVHCEVPRESVFDTFMISFNIRNILSRCRSGEVPGEFVWAEWFRDYDNHLSGQ